METLRGADSVRQADVPAVDLKVGGLRGEPYFGARAEVQLRYCRGRDVDEGGRLPVDVEPDAVCQQA